MSGSPPVTDLQVQGPAGKESASAFCDIEDLKPFVILVIAWDFVLVFFATLFSPPMSGANQLVGLPMSLLYSFPLRESLFFHSLAMPMAALLILAVLGVFSIRARWRSFIKLTSTIGSLVSSGLMAYILLFGGSQILYLAMVGGMALIAVSVMALLVALFPVKEPSASLKLLGRDLPRTVLWMTVVASLCAVAAGSYAALGDPEWGSALVISEFPGLIGAHENLVISVIGAAIVILIAKWFKADRYQGTPGLFVKLGLYGFLIGVPLVVASTFVAVPGGLEVAGTMTVFAGIFLQASLLIMYAVMVGEAKRLHISGPLGIAKESLTFGLLFILFWVNVVITLPGFYVAVHLDEFVGLQNEVAFITGHEHALVTLTAVSLVMLVILMLGLSGKKGAVAGTLMTVGYVLTTSANVLYMFFLVPNGPTYLPYIGAGIAMVMVGMLAGLVGVLVDGRRRTAIPSGQPS